VSLDPYKMLGVRRNASKATIRAAYRKIAKTLHPDAGGDPKAFAAARLAHDVLMDKERRARYDATGELDETRADNAVAEILAVLSKAFDLVIGELFKAGRSPADVDMVKHMREVLAQRHDKLVERQGMERVARDLLQKAVGRFTGEDGASNPLNAMVEAKQRATDQMLEAIAGEMALNERAIQFLKRYGYNFTRALQLQTTVWQRPRAFFAFEVP
jgi:curved DNA-binding protein CbpA